MTLKTIRLFLKHSLWALPLCLSGCGGDDGDDGGGGPGPDPDNGHQDGPGGHPNSGSLAISATADLSGAFGLLVLDGEGGGAGLRLIQEHNERIDKFGLSAPKFQTNDPHTMSLTGASRFTLNGENFEFPTRSESLSLAEGEYDAAMQKIDQSTGEIKDALTQKPPENNGEHHGPPTQPLPPLSTIAVSPTKDVYLQFQYPFQFKDAPADVDVWDMSNGYQCQIFKISGGTLDQLLQAPPAPENLECIDNEHTIDQWQAGSNDTFQFDASGNLYYPGSTQSRGGNNKTVVYRRARDGSATSEVINANICVQNYLITDSGGIFYTGNTCENGGGGGDGGFFRYVAPGTGGAIIEIARDWWNFIFDTTVSNAGTDKAVFFGPDPRNSGTASWDSACLFDFDPSKSNAQERVTGTITCGNNIWDWMEMRRSVDIDNYGYGYHNYTGSDQNFSPSTPWKQEFERRCESKDEVFAGGGSQISSIKQNSVGDVYVIGNIRKKVSGSLTCNVEFRGPHCTVDGIPVLKDTSAAAYTSTTCASAGGTWVDKGRCSDGSATSTECIDHGRTFTAESYCSDSTHTTQSTCEANNKEWYSWSNANNPDDNSGRCTTAGYSGNNDPASAYNNRRWECLPTWNTDHVWYQNVTGDICTETETGTLSTWHDHNSHEWSSGSGPVAGRFVVRDFRCAQDASQGNDWTKEFKSMAKVNRTKSSLDLLSLESEQTIDLWVVQDQVYYSSFDAQLGQYLLNKLIVANSCLDTSKTQDTCSGANLGWSHRRCVNSAYTTKETCEAQSLVWTASYPQTILSNFEVYNIAESDQAGKVFADGLDFSSNQYKFGTIDINTGTMELREGVTGTVKTIVILPK